MTRLRFLLTGILASLAACIPWGTKRLSREDFKVEMVEVQESVDQPRMFRLRARIVDTRNQMQIGFQSKAYDVYDVDDATGCRMEIDDMVRIVIERRLQALA